MTPRRPFLASLSALAALATLSASDSRIPRPWCYLGPAKSAKQRLPARSLKTGPLGQFT